LDSEGGREAQARQRAASRVVAHTEAWLVSDHPVRDLLTFVGIASTPPLEEGTEGYLSPKACGLRRVHRAARDPVVQSNDNGVRPECVGWSGRHIFAPHAGQGFPIFRA